MTQYRIKIVHLFDPTISTEQKKFVDNFIFTKPYYLPQKFVEPIRYNWWVKLFGKKKGWWVTCAPKDVCSEYIGESYAGDGIDHFADIEQCKAWIELLKNEFANKAKTIEFEYIDQVVKEE